MISQQTIQSTAELYSLEVTSVPLFKPPTSCLGSSSLLLYRDFINPLFRLVLSLDKVLGVCSGEAQPLPS